MTVPLPALTALGLITLHAAAGTLRLSDTARVHARWSRIEDEALLDLENTPRLQTELSWRRLSLELEYAPRLAWLDVIGDEPSPTLLLHNAAARASLRGARYRLTLSQTAALGDQGFTRAPASRGPGLFEAAVDPAPDAPEASPASPLELEPLPDAEALAIAAEETSATFHYAWSRRWSSDLRASFGFSGGANARARALLPRERTAELDAALAFRRTRRDRLVTRAGGSQIHTSNGYDHWLGSLQEEWAIDWTASRESGLAAGVAVQDTTGPDGSRSTDLVPLASASFRHAHPLGEATTRFLWNASYAPELNVVLGTLQRRLTASGRVALDTNASSASLTLAAAQTLPTGAPDAARLFTAALAFDHALFEWLAMELGGEITRQRLGGAELPSSTASIWLLYAGLRAHLPETRFRCC